MDIRLINFIVDFREPLGDFVWNELHRAGLVSVPFHETKLEPRFIGLKSGNHFSLYTSKSEANATSSLKVLNIEPQTIIDLVKDKLILNPDGSISVNFEHRTEEGIEPKLGYRLTDGIKMKEESCTEAAEDKFDNDRDTIFKILCEHDLVTQNNLLAEVKKMVVNHRETQINEHNVQSKAIDASIIDLTNKLDLSNRHNQ